MAEDCARYDLPFFLEPLSFSLDADRRLSSEERCQIVVETARKLTPLGVDVLKAEFPVDVHQEQDRKVWEAACKELTEASMIPWTLLSAGVDFDTYVQQVIIACKAGASGVLAGRAVWKEAVDLDGEARLNFLLTTATNRMAELTTLCNELARPWNASIPQPDAGEDWYVRYSDL